MSNNEFDYEMCMRIDNIILPKNGYFGVSAATGGLAGKLIKKNCNTYNTNKLDIINLK